MATIGILGSFILLFTIYGQAMMVAARWQMIKTPRFGRCLPFIPVEESGFWGGKLPKTGSFH